MKYFIASLTGVVLVGCNIGGHYEYSKEALHKTDMTFVCIPTAFGFGFTGTTVPIDKNYSLTAKHVSKYTLNSVVAKSEKCDVSIIKHANNITTKTTFSEAKLGENVTLYGYSGLSGMPVESKGKMLRNVKVDGSYETKDCTHVTTNAGGVSGMSGGVVYNNHGDITGIITSLCTGHNCKKNEHAIILPYIQFKDLLIKAGVDYEEVKH